MKNNHSILSEERSIPLYDGNVNIHPHLRCADCGAVSDMDNSKLSKLQNELIKMLPELDCRSLRLEFSGRCSRCQKNQQEEKIV